MIDWLTIHVEFPAEIQARWLSTLEAWPQWVRSDQGELVAYRYDFQTLKSSSHQITICPRNDGITIVGSPAYSMGLTNNVFGSDNLIDCYQSMLYAALKSIHETLNFIVGTKQIKTRITRIDHTFNLLLESEQQARFLISSIDRVDTGRYRTGRKYGTSLYFGGKSRRMKSKIYIKGTQLRKLIKNGKIEEIEETDLKHLDKVLRLELTYGRDILKGMDIITMQKMLNNQTDEYWSRFFGDAELRDNMNKQGEFTTIRENSESDAQAKAVMRTLTLIRSHGRNLTELGISRATLFRHLRVLRSCGFGEAELAGNAVILRFPVQQILTRRVEDWNELRRIA